MLNGGIFVVAGGNYLANTQEFNGLSVNAGLSSICTNIGTGGSVSLALNAITQYKNFNWSWYKAPDDEALDAGLFGPVTVQRWGTI